MEDLTPVMLLGIVAAVVSGLASVFAGASAWRIASRKTQIGAKAVKVKVGTTTIELAPGMSAEEIGRKVLAASAP